MNWSRIARVIPYALYLALIALYEALLSEPLAVAGAQISLAGLCVLLVAVYKSENTAIWFAAAAMFLSNSGDAAAAGVMMIVAALVAMAASFFKSRLNMESLLARLAIVAVGCLILELLRTAFLSTTELLWVYLRYSAPTVAYTVVVAWLFFLFKDGYISGRAVRRLF